jgi:hypothetical protein
MPTVGNYAWIGCYTDTIGSRTLIATSEVNHNIMTVKICASFCAGYKYFGVEFSKTHLINVSNSTNFHRRRKLLRQYRRGKWSSCRDRRLLRPLQWEQRMSITVEQIAWMCIFLSFFFFFRNATSPTTSSSTGSASITTAYSAAVSMTAAGPVHVPSIGSYQWIGCYTDAIGNRPLTALTETNYKTMSVEICASFCSAYNMFAVEYSMYFIIVLKCSD